MELRYDIKTRPPGLITALIGRLGILVIVEREFMRRR